MTQLLQLLAIAGATGLFLYSMKLISESVQKIAGEKMRVMLSNMSSNHVRGIIMGIVITAMIQSSSATTVMVVSFANAGFILLADAIAVIIGANVGTTITTWIIAGIGLQSNLFTFTLPIIGVSIPLIFSKSRKVKNWGELLLGISLLFISINFLRQEVPVYAQSWLSESIAFINHWRFIALPIFLATGIFFTILVKSSSAIFALTMILCMNGWIGFENAATMILGSNVGTTFSAMNASRIANATAKRAALAHFFFNIFGAIWAIAFMQFVIKGIAYIFHESGYSVSFHEPNHIPLALAAFHTVLNFISAILVSLFMQPLKRLLTRLATTSQASDQDFRLTHIKIGLLSTPEASLFQARRETIVFAEKVRKMFRNVERLFAERNEKEFQSIHKKLTDGEEYANRLEKEIASYLTKVAEGRLSESSSRRLRALFKMIDDVESIADSCINIRNAIARQRTKKIFFPDQIINNVQLMFNMVNDSLDTMVTMLTHEEELHLSSAEKIEQEINDFRDILKSEHLNNLEKGIYNYDAGIIYNDIISQCERIGDYAMNVDEASKNQF